MKNGVTITIHLDGDLYEYRYDADVKWELKTNLDVRLEQYLRFKAIDCMAFMQEEGH